MKKLHSIVLFLFSVLLLFSTSSFASDNIFPLNQIKPGMQGTALTIFANDQIDSFKVEVLGVMKDFFPGRSLIIIQLLGKKAEHTGVAAGMSGSPVYFQGRLAGALAYSFGNFMKDPIAGVTPIEEMMAIFDKEKNRSREAPHLSSELQRPSQKLAQSFFSFQKLGMEDLFSVFKSINVNYVGNFKPIKTPLVVSGFQPNILNAINREISQTNFQMIAAADAQENFDKDSDELLPGGAVSAILIHGDYDISAMGTVTYSDGKRILAFGHPFFDSGPVAIPMAKGHVLTTLSSLASSMKFGAAGKIIGTVRQDRSSGIMGVIGVPPKMIPVQVSVLSPLTGKKIYNYRLSSDKSHFPYLPIFLWMTLINTIESSRMANGDFALQLNGKIEVKNYDDIVFDNFYAGGDLGFYTGSGNDMPQAAIDVVMSLNSLLMNDFLIPEIEKINLTFSVVPGPKSAVIEKILIEKNRVKPGDTVNVYVDLKPFHRKTMRTKRELILPQNLTREKVSLIIGSGSFVAKNEIRAGLSNAKPRNFQQLIRKLNARKRNNFIYFQIREKIPGTIILGKTFQAVPPSILGQRASVQQKSDYSVKERILAEDFLKTDFDISGGKIIELTVEQ